MRESPFTEFLAKVNCQVIQFTKSGCEGELLVNNLVAMEQIHSNHVVEISKLNGAFWAGMDGETVELDPTSHSNADALGYSGLIYSITGDAMFTKDHGVGLTVKTADCLPILVSAGPFIGVIHAGREGTLSRISIEMANRLYAYGINNAALWFGPASCVCCYQIDRETNSYFDLIAENKAQWQEIFGSNVQFYCSNDCTQCSPDRFFSYRSGDSVRRNVFGIAKLQ